jgi:hypothetical protein
MNGIDMEKEIMRIQLTHISEIQRVFGVEVAAAYKIRNGKTDPSNSKTQKAVKELGWNAEALAHIREEWLKNHS